MKKGVSTFSIIWITWILLTGLNTNELILGFVVSVLLSYVIRSIIDYEFSFNSIPKIIKFFVVYIPVFLLELIKANLDVAYRVLSPSMPINPGFVRIPTNIKSEYGRLTLANSITLTPGTISVDVSDDSVYIHWIDVKGSNNEEYQKNVSGSFEKILGGIFN
ncbi:Na+/H+ antiporter subunit E [Helicovermis profundi]|uniref:Na+/H+ antiporter subunit E n=1 Tax=Helicovermis profundi TaxID=3065157 RepID=A0AAU9EIP0_9FIRM|nr:Na+/H+ antiporter subunit E [Clostridia bacterium S502]